MNLFNKNKPASKMSYFFPEGSLFNNFSFLYLWSAQFITQVGNRLFDFVLAIQIFKQTGSNASVSYLIISYGAPAFLFGALAGMLVDKLNKKMVLLAVNFIRALLLVIFIFITKSFSVILIFAFLVSLVTQFFIPAEGSIIPRIVKGDNLLTANSFFSLTLYASSVIGFIGAGPLIKTLGNNGSYVFIAVMFLVSVFLVSFVPNTEEHKIFKLSLFESKETPFERLISKFRESLDIIHQNIPVRNALLFLGLSQLIVAMYLGLLPGLAVEVLKLRPEDVSIYLVGPSAVGMLLGAAYVSNYGNIIGKLKLMKTGIFGGGITFMLFYIVPKFEGIEKLNMFLNQVEKIIHYRGYISAFSFDATKPGLVFSFIFLALLSGVFNSFITITNNTIIQEETSEEDRGKMYGFLQTIVTVAGAVPIIAAGLSADMFGVANVFLAIGFFILLIFLLSTKALDYGNDR